MRSILSIAFSLMLFGITAAALESTCPTEFEKETARLINLERQKVGLSPLTRDVRLVSAAREHSRDMGTECFLSHTGSDGSTPGERTKGKGYQHMQGEIIAMGYSTPEEVVVGWMNSPTHKKIILTPDHLHYGGTHYFDSRCPYEHYWTFVFGAAPITARPNERCDN